METVRKTLDFKRSSSLEMLDPDQAIRAALEEFGLTSHEIALYRSALALGPRPASILAKRIRVQRTRVYDLLSSLQFLGLMEMVERNHVRYYSATPPDRLLTLIRNRKEHIELQLNELENAIPLLFSNIHSCAAAMENHTVRGMTLVKDALEGLLEEEQDSIMSFGDVEQVLRENIGSSRWATKFRETRISRGILMRIMVTGPASVLEEKALLREVLSNPAIPAEVLVVASRKAILALDFSDTIQATRIQSGLICSLLWGLYDSWRSSMKGFTA